MSPSIAGRAPGGLLLFSQIDACVVGLRVLLHRNYLEEFAAGRLGYHLGDDAGVALCDVSYPVVLARVGEEHDQYFLVGFHISVFVLFVVLCG